MKSRLMSALGLARYFGSSLCNLYPLYTFAIISITFQYYEARNVPGTSQPSASFANSSSLSSIPLSSLLKSSKASEEAASAQLQPDALARLSRVFGISRIPRREFHRSPPQYMQDLYASLTDTGGLTRASGPYNSNVIRSFPDSDSVHRMHFQYNISYLEEDERILEAEFHLFKMRPAPSSTNEPSPPHIIMIKVYQVMDIREMASTNGTKLLDARRISAHGHGWHVFNVTSAILSWHYREAKNFGLLVTTETTAGIHVNGSYIRFAQRKQHHNSKQPILVVFTNNGQRKHPNYISPSDEEYLEIREDILRRERQKHHHLPGDFRSAVRKLNEKDRLGHKTSASRVRRSTNNRSGGRGKRTFETYRYRHNRRSCTRYEMFVDFEEIGWSGWIISPNSYNAYHCTGDCPFPLGQSQKPTNHATVQSIVHALGVGKNIGTPCCVPNKLYSISLLYFDDNENVILKQYDDMVVASCGCH